ncbi:cyanophycinase [Pseudoduganella sp. FT93W]|uniref:Cyanophycinase n=1 Tax=Duganella fentianensis TaxID=2692177 RepID=A0A845HQR2_9BURK|nr:cyanophycinase [Duganella fentianensis]MYN43784.1 cyanophycinase [Duganella fentianensis]
MNFSGFTLLRVLLLWLLLCGASVQAAQVAVSTPAAKAPAGKPQQAAKSSSKPAKAVPPPKPVLAPPAGNLVIIGGGLRADNAEVWQRIVQLAGGKGARIGVFGSASINPEQSAQNTINKLNQYGAQAFFIPLGVTLPNSDYRKAAEDPEVVAAIHSATGIYFTGGDQARITRALVRPDGKHTAALDAVWDVYRDGGVVAGSSAGAAIMSTTMFYDAKSTLEMLKQGVTEGNEISAGLGFIGDDVFVDQHLLVRGRFARMIPVMLKKGYQIGLGIDENTAMVVNARRDVEIIGYSGALLLDLSAAITDRGIKGFNISNATISYLDRGDKFNLVTREFTPSPDKADNKLDPNQPETREPVFTNDILGNNAVLDLMVNLIDNAQQEAIGIAFGNPRDAYPDIGFEFRFSKTINSVGYSSTEVEAYSVLKLRMDVRPIQLQAPLYRYR